ncbi:MAG: hypothetical protein ACE5ES_02680 [Candidatus Nanoarchaeia archaeon]
MVIKSHENSVAAWAFLIGVILAVVIGLSTTLLPIPALTRLSSAIFAILVLIGLFVGFTTNVSGKDSQTFLLAGTVLVIVSNFGKSSITGSLIGFNVADAVNTVFGALLALFVPATIIVALKMVFSISKI